LRQPFRIDLHHSFRTWDPDSLRVTVYEPYEDAVGRGHQCVLNSLLVEILRHLASPEIGPERHWGRVHDLLNSALGITVQLLMFDESQDDTVSIHDNERLPSITRGPIPHIAYPVFEPHGRNIAPGDICDARNASVVAFARQPGSEPVSLPRLVSVDGEPESFEPRRGPRAQISLVVVAIGDDGSARVELLGALAIQRLERDIKRARDVFGLVFSRSEDLDQLTALLEKLLDALTIDHRGHVYLLRLLYRVGGGDA
jgi:hypothetical protein